MDTNKARWGTVKALGLGWNSDNCLYWTNCRFVDFGAKQNFLAVFAIFCSRKLGFPRYDVPAGKHWLGGWLRDYFLCIEVMSRSSMEGVSLGHSSKVDMYCCACVC